MHNNSEAAFVFQSIFLGLGKRLSRKTNGSVNPRQENESKNQRIFRVPETRAKLNPPAEGKVRVPTPFGYIDREPIQLPPMISLAAETPDHPEQSRRIAELKEMLTSKKQQDIVKAMQELTFYPKDKSLPILLYYLNDCKDELARSLGIFCLAKLCDGKDACWEYINKMLFQDESNTVRSAAASVLGYMDDTEVVETLVRSFYDDGDWLVKVAAVNALGMLHDSRAISHLLDALKKIDTSNDSESLVVQSLIGALATLRAPAEDVLDQIIRFKDSKDVMVRGQVAESLCVYGGVEGDKVIPVLEELQNDEMKHVRNMADFAINYIKNGTESNFLKEQQEREQKRKEQQQ